MNITTEKGVYASRSGRILEKNVIATLKQHNFQIINYREYRKNPKKYSDELLLKNAPFTTIYDHPGKSEFLLKSKKYKLNIRIECKWQQSSGSVDEKFPYLYLNCIERIPEKEIIIILECKGAKKGSVNWIKNAIKNNIYNTNGNKKNIKIMELTEFISWTNQTFK